MGSRETETKDARDRPPDVPGGPKARAKRFPRRRFLRRLAIGAGGTVALGAFAGGYARYVEPFWIEYHDVEVSIPHLPAEFDGFTIAHVSDIHCGKLLGPDRVRAMLERVRGREPDIVAVTGDLVYSGGNPPQGSDAYSEVLEELGRIAREIPTYVVPGNHDYWEGIERFRQGVPAAGAVDLTNAHRVIERRSADGGGGSARLVLAGLDDPWEGKPDIDRALAGVDRAAQPVVVLMHNPDFFEEVRGKGVSLVLAGHTHGGQVKPPFMAPPFLPVKHKQYASGLFEEDGTTMYVSRGVGMIMRVRFNCRPEVAFIVLKKE